MKRIILIILCVLIVLTIAVGCSNQTEPTITNPDNEQVETTDKVTYRLGHMSQLATSYHRSAVKFSELVSEKSDGRIEIIIYPQAQLGYDMDLIEALQYGNLDFAVVTASTVSNFEKLFGVVDMPYLFEDWDHIKKFQKSDVAKELAKEAWDDNLIPMAFMPFGYRSVSNSQRPIYTVEDIAGLKLRVIESPAYVKTFEDFNVVVSAMSVGELITALQQGAIDGQENPPEITFNGKYYEGAKYFSLTEHISAFSTIMGSKSIMDNMPVEDRKIIEEAALEACLEIGDDVIVRYDEYIDKLKDEIGLEINEVDKEGFIAAATSAYEWFEQENGEKGKGYIDAIRALNN